MTKSDIKSDALAFVSAFSVQPDRVSIGGRSITMFPPTLSRALRLLKRFPNAADFVSKAILGVDPEASNDPNKRAALETLWKSTIFTEGSDIAYAWLAECLGVSDDAEFEASLSKLEEAVQYQLFAKSLSYAPTALDGFFGACIATLELHAPAAVEPKLEDDVQAA